MDKRKKPNLNKALKKVDNRSNSLFGAIEIDINTLPCMSKPKKEKITANFDKDLLQTIRSIAHEKKIPYTEIINDVLKSVFLKNKKHQTT